MDIHYYSCYCFPVGATTRLSNKVVHFEGKLFIDPQAIDKALATRIASLVADTFDTWNYYCRHQPFNKALQALKFIIEGDESADAAKIKLAVRVHNLIILEWCITMEDNKIVMAIIIGNTTIIALINIVILYP